MDEAGALGTTEDGTLDDTAADEIADVPTGELGRGAATEVKEDGTTVEVTGGATQCVQIVEMLVTWNVDTLRLVWMT